MTPSSSRIKWRLEGLNLESFRMTVLYRQEKSVEKEKIRLYGPLMKKVG
jgi:hypothetical protein